MQSTNEWKEWKRYFSAKEDASAATRRDGLRTTRKAAIEAVGSGILVLLFLASLGYVVFGGTFELVSSPKAETSKAAVAARPADAGGAPAKQKSSSSPDAPSDYFPAGYVNRGRDGDGNVMTYEHD